MQLYPNLMLILCLLLTITGASGHNQIISDNNTFNTVNSSNQTTQITPEINNNTTLEPPLCVPTTIYVGPKGKKSNNGLTRDKPLYDIGEALKIAPDNSTIILQKGTYTFNLYITNNNPEYIQGRNLIFQGEDLENTKIIPYTGTPAFIIDINCDFTLKNLKIENGNTPDNGGAIYNQGRLTIINCQFRNNIAQKRGGAIYNNGNIFTTNSYFKNNQATEGGAIYNNENSIFIATSCHFIKNNATLGGAIYQENSKTPEDPLNIHLTEFQKNHAYHGDTIYLENTHQQVNLDDNWWGHLDSNKIKEMLGGSITLNPTLKATRNCKITTSPIITATEGYTFPIQATLQNQIHQRLKVQVPDEPLIFYLDGQKLGMVKTNEDGTSTITSKNYVNPGIHHIKIMYPGNTLYDPVTITSTVNVKKGNIHPINQTKNVPIQKQVEAEPVPVQDNPQNLLDMLTNYLKELVKYLPWLLVLLTVLGSIILILKK